MSTAPNPNAPHIVLNVQPGAPSFTLNVGEGGCWVSFGDQPEAEEPEEDPFAGTEALGGITALPGSRIELADEVDSQPFEKPAPKTVVVMNRLAEASDCWDLADGDDIITAFASMPHTLRGWTAETVYVSTWAAEVPGLLDQVRARQASFPDARLLVMPIEEIRDELVRQRSEQTSGASEGLRRELLIKMKVRLVPETEVELISDRDGTETITLVSGVDEDNEGTEYDTVSQDDIRKGDIIEYHEGDTVRRWAVLCCGKKPYGRWVQLQLLDGPIHATEVVTLPLPGDPFILRPRSS